MAYPAPHQLRASWHLPAIVKSPVTPNDSLNLFVSIQLTPRSSGSVAEGYLMLKASLLGSFEESGIRFIFKLLY